MNQRTFLEQLDAVDNEAEFRERLAAGNYNARQAALAQEWLLRKESSRNAEVAVHKEAREEEGLAISRKALANSQLATIIAIVAIVLSVVMALQRVIEWLSK